MGRSGCWSINAGHGGGGPVEEVPLSLVRETFDTNVFGLIRMCQLAPPCMRAQRSGLIVNLGSAAGLVTPPTGCPYAMTEYASPRWHGASWAIAGGTRSCAAWCPSPRRSDPRGSGCARTGQARPLPPR
jgi:hypothetical protein